MQNMEVSRPRSRVPSLIAIAAALAMSGPLAAAGAPVENLRIGDAARVLARHVEGGYETLVLSVDAGACVDPWIRGWQVHLDVAAGEPQPWSGVATQPHRDPRPPVAATVAASPAPAHP